MRRTLVLGDLHLSSHTPRAVSDDLAALVRAHPGARIAVAGDFFDLSAESPRVASDRAIEAGFAAYPHVRAALGEHLDKGGELIFLAGNHDPELGQPDAKQRIGAALALDAAARERVSVSPWFFRDEALHVEHGHLFDPDNAPEHPLAIPRASLGVHFVEEFIAPTGAFSYLNTNDGTPLKLFFSAFRLYGPRGPYVVYKYFAAAAKALGKSGPFYLGRHEEARGEASMTAFLAGAGASRELADAILSLRAAPTMRSLSDTVARLYLDRVASTVSILAGVGLLATGRFSASAGLVALGAMGLAASWSRGHDRYGGSVPLRLADAGSELARATQAKLVVFGHAHVSAEADGYANTGSFAFPRREPGRSFLEIEGTAAHPRAVRRYWGAPSAEKP